MADTILTGKVLDEQQITLDELAVLCSCETDWILELVEEGVIEPLEKDKSAWLFSGKCVVRVRTAIRLKRDLDINLPGIALAMDLLDELENLRTRLDVLD